MAVQLSGIFEWFGQVHGTLDRRWYAILRCIRYMAYQQSNWIVGLPPAKPISYLTKNSNFFYYFLVIIFIASEIEQLSLTRRWWLKSDLLPTSSIGNSSRSLTRRICFWNLLISAKLLWSVNENTNKNPSPDRMYCSRIALNSSWPAVSRTRIRETLWK